MGKLYINLNRDLSGQHQSTIEIVKFGLVDKLVNLVKTSGIQTVIFGKNITGSFLSAG
jgi:hypothetical protein